MAYWDTSRLLKLYASELDSVMFAVHAAGGTTVTSALARLELHAAVQRKESLGDLSAGVGRTALATYDADVATGLVLVRPMDPAVFGQFYPVIERCYRRVPPVHLRTLDAIHLATAIVTGEPEVVTADKRLRDAAVSFGLSVFPLP